MPGGRGPSEVRMGSLICAHSSMVMAMKRLPTDASEVGQHPAIAPGVFTIASTEGGARLTKDVARLSKP